MSREQLRAELIDALEGQATRLRLCSRSRTWQGPRWADSRAALRSRAAELEKLAARITQMNDTRLRWLASALSGEV